MNKAVPWSIKGVDFDAREAAEAAARRAGMSVGEWLKTVIAERAAEQDVTPEELDTDERLEAVTTRLERMSHGGNPRERRSTASGSDLPFGERRRSDSPMRAARPKPPERNEEEEGEPRHHSRPREVGFMSDRHSEALLDQAIAAFERRATAAQRQTANALADVTDWMEESRSQRKRDREMLSTVADRLAKIEARVSSEPKEDSFAPVRDAISRLEERFEALARPAPEPPAIENTLRGLDEKLNALAARMDRPRPQPAPAPEPLPAPAPQRPVIRLQTQAVGDAVAEIVRRRNHLDGVSHASMASHAMSGLDQRLEAITKRLEEAADQASGREKSESAALENLRKDVAGLASRLEDIRRGETDRNRDNICAGERRIESLREEIAAMSRSVAELAPRARIEAIESAIRDLTLKIESSRMNGARDALLQPIEEVTADLRQAIAALDPRGVVERLENEVRSIAGKLDCFQAAGGIDPDAFNRICEQTREVRDLLSAAASRPLPIEKIEQQINALAERLDALPASLPRGEEGDARPSLGALRSIIAEAEAPAFTSLQRRLEDLSQKFDEARAEKADSPQLEAMLRALADKLETALASRSDGAHDALERQIQLLSARLDKSDRSLVSISSLDSSIGELFARLEETRRAAINAAEDVARETLRDALPGSGAGSMPKELSRELADLRAAQDVADQRLHSTLTAVHDTLEKVVDRLSLLEDDVAGSRGTVLREPLASGAPPVFAPPRRADEARDNAGLRLPETKRADAPRDDADVLIEPGTGFRPGAESEPKPAASERASVAPSQANFIAAARRAVAAAQAAGAEFQPPSEKRRAAGKEGAIKPGLRSRFGNARAALNARKRPILLGLAGLLLLIGAYEVLRMGGDNKDAPRPAAKMETPASPKPRNEAAAPKADPTPTQTFAASKPPKIETAPPAPAAVPAPAPVAPATSEPAAAAPSPNAKIDPAPTSTIPQTPSAMAAIPAAKDNVAGLQSLAITGDASAQYELAARYSEGRGVNRDPKLAAQWLEKAANQGLAPAQYRLGSVYEKGIGVTRDLAASKIWYQRAAEAGNVRAMHNLAVLIAEGSDGKPDYASAANWFKQAAEYGVRDSQFNLAILYARGLGVTQNLVQSYLWFALAAKQGDEDAGKKSQDVAARMDPKDLATAKSLADSFQPKEARKAANEVVTPGTNWEGVKPPIGADLKITPPKLTPPKVSRL